MQKKHNINKYSKHKVFIVDDHSIVREGLTQLINREKDLEVCGESASASDALKAVKDCKPEIIIVDLSLEDGSGIRLIENLMYTYDNLLILVYSMHDESTYAERCLRAGAKGYITKQEPSEKIVPAIRTVLNGEIYLSKKLGARLLNKLLTKKAGISEPLEHLSNREMEVYQLLGQGLKKREIAEKLNLSIKTIDNYVEHIKAKMDLRDTHEVILHAIKNAMKI